jgi:outer membrane protein
MLKQSEIKMNRLKLDNGTMLATMAFCQHLGIPYDSLLILTDTVQVMVIPDSMYCDHDQALSRRVEYQLVQDNVEAEKLKTRMKTGEYLPQVGVGVGAFTFDMDQEWNNDLMAFGTVTIPLTDWWGGSYEIKEQKLHEQIAQNNADFAATQLKLQMEKVRRDLIEAYQQVKIAEESVGQAKENLKITGDNHDAGTIGISDLLEAQALYQSTLDQLTDARCAYRVKMAEYLKVTGKD